MIHTDTDEIEVDRDGKAQDMLKDKISCNCNCVSVSKVQTVLGAHNDKIRTDFRRADYLMEGCVAGDAITDNRKYWTLGKRYKCSSWC